MAGVETMEDQEPPDTRPAPRADAAGDGEPVVTAPGHQVSLQNLLTESLDRSLATAQLHGWSTVLDNVGQLRRELVRLGLWRYRRGQALEADQAARWPDLLAQLTQQWTAYEARAHRVVEAGQERLTAAQQQLCRDVLVALHARWQQQLAALATLPGTSAWPDEQAATLAELQQVWDQPHGGRWRTTRCCVQPSTRPGFAAGS